MAHLVPILYSLITPLKLIIISITERSKLCSESCIFGGGILFGPISEICMVTRSKAYLFLSYRWCRGSMFTEGEGSMWQLTTDLEFAWAACSCTSHIWSGPSEGPTKCWDLWPGVGTPRTLCLWRPLWPHCYHCWHCSWVRSEVKVSQVHVKVQSMHVGAEWPFNVGGKSSLLSWVIAT